MRWITAALVTVTALGMLVPAAAAAAAAPAPQFVLTDPAESWPCADTQTVFIDTAHMPQDYRQMPAVLHALDTWRTATHRSWRQVQSPEAATLTIKWDPDLSSTEGGRTGVSVNGAFYNRAVVVLSVQWSRRQAFVILHELGHVAGLGHTTDPDSVMLAQEPDYSAAQGHYGAGDLVGLAVANWRCTRRSAA